jgi:hypothetical protein
MFLPWRLLAVIASHRFRKKCEFVLSYLEPQKLQRKGTTALGALLAIQGGFFITKNGG